MRQKKLFEIDSIINDFETRTITVNVKDNNYVSNHVIVDFDELTDYLNKHNQLYYETHDFSTGQYINKSHTMSIEEYLENVDHDYLEEDLYDYLIATSVNWRRAANKILMQSNHIMNQIIN